MSRRCISALVCKRWEQLASSPQLQREVKVSLWWAGPSDPVSTRPRLTSLCHWLLQPGRAALIEDFYLAACLGFHGEGAPTPEAADAAADCAGLLAACLGALASGGSLQELALAADSFMAHTHVGACASLGALKRLEILTLIVRGPLEMGPWTRGLQALRRMHVLGWPIIWSPEAVLPAHVTRLTLADRLSTSLPAQARRFMARRGACCRILHVI